MQKFQWKPLVLEEVQRMCNTLGSRTFTLQELHAFSADVLKKAFPSNNNIEAKVRQTLQYLRDDNLIQFNEAQRGHYTLLAELLESEVEESAKSLILSQPTEKREYLIETFARNKGWVKQAKEKLGHSCLLYKCENTFNKPNGERYIEVHHIVPLCEGGEDGVWNLSVLCAHHHKMAHFADDDTRLKLKKILTRTVEKRLQESA
jgi:predicted HNH restriction endonuclease